MSAEVSKAIRLELKKVFPGVKFSVTTPYYGKVNIRWKDNVIKEDVENVVNKYDYEVNSRDDIPQCRFVFCNRDYSDRAIEQAIKAVKSKYGLNGMPVTPAMYNRGELYNFYVVPSARGNISWSLQTQISQWLSKTEIVN